MVTLGELVAKDMVPKIMREVRTEMVAMLRRVAAKESDPKVAARLREIADAFMEAGL